MPPLPVLPPAPMVSPLPPEPPVAAVPPPPVIPPLPEVPPLPDRPPLLPSGGDEVVPVEQPAPAATRSARTGVMRTEVDESRSFEDIRTTVGRSLLLRGFVMASCATAAVKKRGSRTVAVSQYGGRPFPYQQTSVSEQ